MFRHRPSNGAVASYAYDTAGRLTSLNHKTSTGATIAGFAYTLDNVGNRLTKTQPDTKDTYSYDAIYRLLKSLPTKLTGKDKDQDNKSETFAYDRVGNRLTGPQTADAYSYDKDNELTNDSKHSYRYDNNGNLIEKTGTDDDGTTKTWTYGYDYENRLVKAIKQEGTETETVTFKYDPFGRRVEKKVEEIEGGTTETKTYNYVYDNEDVVLEYLTKTEDGATKTEVTGYIHGPGIDEPLAIERKGDVYYYHADGLGSITALTDSNQKTVESYTYSAFGELKRKGDKVKNTFTYTGREWDEETGLYYYRARYYDAKAGRFISKDPIGFAGGVNFYLYIDNDPINYADPSGLKSKKYWIPPDLNPPSTTPTPDTGEIDYPYAPLKNSAQNSCPVCSPTFHANVYWSCVGYSVMQNLGNYGAAFIGMVIPNGFTQALGFVGAVTLSNDIAYTCHNVATYCD